MIARIEPKAIQESGCPSRCRPTVNFIKVRMQLSDPPALNMSLNILTRPFRCRFEDCKLPYDRLPTLIRPKHMIKERMRSGRRVLGQACDPQTRQIDASPVGTQISCNRRQQCGLPAAISPKQPNAFPAFDDYINAGEQCPAATGEFQPAESDHGRRAERSSNAIICSPAATGSQTGDSVGNAASKASI